jgi:hypothetical protein
VWNLNLMTILTISWHDYKRKTVLGGGQWERGQGKDKVRAAWVWLKYFLCMHENSIMKPTSKKTELTSGLRKIHNANFTWYVTCAQLLLMLMVKLQESMFKLAY